MNESDSPPNATVCAKAEQCVARKYDQESIVCVCNATYCDLIEPTTADQLAGNVARHYISTIEVDIANATYFQVTKNVTHQQILGFGGAMTDSAAIHINSLSEEAQNLLLSAYFSPEGLEYSFVRVPIGGSDFSTHYYAYDDVANDSILRYFNLTEEDYSFKKAKAISKVSDQKRASLYARVKRSENNKCLVGKEDVSYVKAKRFDERRGLVQSG
ncbi:unnamed protein product [Timema podura]|uniref:Glucosylceramidase n=1 Tax=Timema podura TaxID=61482 RepID=A0ABN7NJV4_TIMPD|nr:unnamed protein product [Timema podura]